MALDNASKLGKNIGTLSKQQNQTSENISPEEADSTLLLKQQETIEIVGTATFTAKYYDLTSFIIDHPIAGELDSSVLEIDGGYAQTGESFPLTFPFSFAAGTSSSTLYSTTF